MEKQITSLHQQLLKKSEEPPTVIAQATNNTSEESSPLLALENKLASVMEKQQNYFTSLYQQNVDALNTVQQQTNTQMDHLEALLKGQNEVLIQATS